MSILYMCADSEYIKNWMIDLINSNPLLTGNQVRKYALQIAEAEAREDFVRMNALIQKAVWGKTAGENKVA